MAMRLVRAINIPVFNVIAVSLMDSLNFVIASYFLIGFTAIRDWTSKYFLISDE